jgi:hydroxymethylpyrimidine pyrophosphatase-like HAD family hydrolase
MRGGGPAAAAGAVVTDFDRTFTRPDLSLDPESLAAVRRLREAGIPAVLATGRRARDLEAWPEVTEAFDGFVLECGAVWGRWGDWRLASERTADVHRLADDLEAQGCALDRGAASCSVPAEWGPRLQAHPLRPRVSVQPNRDRIDVVPGGVDKAVGLRLLLPALGLPEAPLLSVGDGENDLPVFAMAGRAVAVANAAPVARQAAHEVAPAEASKGFLWAVAPLLGEAAAAPAGAGAAGAVGPVGPVGAVARATGASHGGPRTAPP